LENDWRAAIGAPDYVPPERGRARPTAIPRKEILPFSLTPQPQAETVGSKAEEPTPGARTEPVARAPTAVAGQEESAPTSDDGGASGGGSACGRPYGSSPLDASTLALAVGLVGLGFRRRLFR